MSDLITEKQKGMVNALGSPIYGRIVFVSLTAIFLFLTLYRYPFFPVFYDGDHVIQMYDAVRMLEGDVIYRDFFQFTFPGTEVWYLLLFKIFGQRFWLLNGTILFLGLSLAWALLELSFRVTKGWLAYLAPAIFMFLGFRWLATDGSHRLFSLLFAVLAIYVVSKGITTGRLFLAGVLTGCASFFTQTRGIAVIAGLMLFFLWHYWPRDGSSPITALKNISKAVFMLVGAFLVTLGTLLAYFIFPAPGQFFESTLYFGKNYLADPANQWTAVIDLFNSVARGELTLLFLLVFFYIAIGIVASLGLLFFYIKDHNRVSRELWHAPMLLLLAGIGLVLSSPGTVRLCHASVLMLILFAWVAERSLRHTDRTTNTAWLTLTPAYLINGIVIAAMAVAVWSFSKGYKMSVEMPMGTAVFLTEPAGERMKWTADHTRPGEYVFEAYRTSVNLPLQLKNPTKFSMLRDNDYTSREDVADVVRDLENKRPRYILWNGYWSLRAEQRSEHDHLGPLYNFILENYVLREEIPPIYDLKTEIWERAK